MATLSASDSREGSKDSSFSCSMLFGVDRPTEAHRLALCEHRYLDVALWIGPAGVHRRHAGGDTEARSLNGSRGDEHRKSNSSLARLRVEQASLLNRLSVLGAPAFARLLVRLALCTARLPACLAASFGHLTPAIRPLAPQAGRRVNSTHIHSLRHPHPIQQQHQHRHPTDPQLCRPQLQTINLIHVDSVIDSAPVKTLDHDMTFSASTSSSLTSTSPSPMSTMAKTKSALTLIHRQAPGLDYDQGLLQSMGLKTSRGLLTQHGGCDLGLRYLAALLQRRYHDTASTPTGDPDPRLRPSRDPTLTSTRTSAVISFSSDIHPSPSTFNILKVQQFFTFVDIEARGSGSLAHMGGSGRQGGRDRGGHKGRLVGLPDLLQDEIRQWLGVYTEVFAAGR
ncbi:hypothetical protein V8E36_007038 [Tilletia maclaganii]